MSQKISSPRRLSLLIACSGLVVLLGLLIADFYREKQTNPVVSNPASKSRVDVGGDFTLVDTKGVTRTQADFADKYMLIYFGFSFCPDVCPMALDIMGAALDQLSALDQAKAEAVQPVFISIDPARDTPEALAEYIQYFHPNLVGLTGSQAQIDATLKAYRVYAARAPAMDGDAPDAYMMDHSSIFYLMDRDNQFVAHFDHSTTPEKMAAQLSARLP